MITGAISSSALTSFVRTLMYSHKTDDPTTDKLDIDITSPQQGVPAYKNITWTDRNRMDNATYRFFVLQFSNNNAYQSGFRAEIEFDGQSFYYDYPNELPNKSTVDMAYVTLSNGRFSIRYSISPSS